MRQLVIFLVAFGALSASAAPMSFQCSFTRYADDIGGLRKTDKPFELSYLIDTETEKAYIIGNNGSAEVTLISNKSGFSLIEVTPSGNVMVTAISVSTQAVHSRNVIAGDKIIPSQYYGTCVRKQ